MKDFLVVDHLSDAPTRFKVGVLFGGEDQWILQFVTQNWSNVARTMIPLRAIRVCMDQNNLIRCISIDNHVFDFSMDAVQKIILLESDQEGIKKIKFVMSVKTYNWDLDAHSPYGVVSFGLIFTDELWDYFLNYYKNMPVVKQFFLDTLL